MNKRMLLMSFAVAALLPLVIVIGCKKDDEQSAGSKPQAALPADLFVTKAPASAKTVEEVKKSAKAGEVVTVRGLVGGSLEPFVEGRAVFTLMGPGLKPCGSGSPMPDCKTPWDYCCDVPEDIAAHSATIQVVDANGSPLRLNFKGQHNVKELSDLTIVGQVKQIDQKLLVINATKIFVP